MPEQPRNLRSIELLTPQREAELFDRIRAGLDLQDYQQAYCEVKQRVGITGHNVFERLKTYEAVATDDARDAHNEVINKNLRLIGYVASKNFDLLDRNSGGFDDRMQDGFTGLSEAAWRYIPNVGAKFSTFAHRSIKNAMDTKKQFQMFPFSIPVNLRPFLTAYLARVFNGAEATQEELLYAVSEKYHCSLIRVQDWFSDVVSLEEVTEELLFDDYTGKTLEDESAPSTILENVDNEFFDDVFVPSLWKDYLLDALSELELHVLFLRKQGLTCEEVGEIKGFSKQRASQIEHKAVAKLSERIASTPGIAA